jgi:hypothetical protein
MKTAKFYALGSFLLRSRNLFVIVGDVLEGEVTPGMRISIPLGGIAVATRVASVEYVDVIHEGKSFIGLAMEYEHPEELEFLMGLGVSGEVLTLDTEPG